MFVVARGGDEEVEVVEHGLVFVVCGLLVFLVCAFSWHSDQTILLKCRG